MKNKLVGFLASLALASVPSNLIEIPRAYAQDHGPQPQSCSWNYAIINGVSTATYCGNVVLPSGTAANNLGLNVPLTTPAVITVGATGAQFTNLSAAFSFLSNTIITAPVTINVADGTYACPGEINHPQGALISVIGDTVNPANVVIQASQQNFAPCWLVKNNHALGLIDGMTIQATDGYSSPGIWTGTYPYGFGIYAYLGGSINVGYHVTISKYYYAERAELGGKIYNQNNGSTGPTASICGDVCFHAFDGGTIECRYCHASFAADVNSSLGAGYLAEDGGSLVVPNSFASYNATAGFGALNGGSAWTQNTVSGHNGQFGYRAFVRASIDATSGAASYNGGSWVASTAYPLWSIVINGSKEYIQTVSAGCTSASSGGPSNSSGISPLDGTCLWQYFGAVTPGNGYEADRDGTIVAYGSEADHSGADGYFVNGGTIDANTASANFNIGISFHATHIGKIYGTVGTQSGNGTNTPTADATSLVNF